MWKMVEYNEADFTNLLESAKDYLSNREKWFIESVMGQCVNRGHLTPGQTEWFNSLKEKYSPLKIQEFETWRDNFSDHHRRIARQVAAYYSTTAYFQEYTKRVIENPKSFTFTKQEWDHFCENKYAKKIRENYNNKPKFGKSDCIQIRASNRIDLANASNPKRSNHLASSREANKIGFVLEVDAKPVTRAAKGSRVYKILLIGEVSPIYAHESDLKRKR